MLFSSAEMNRQLINLTFVMSPSVFLLDFRRCSKPFPGGTADTPLVDLLEKPKNEFSKEWDRARGAPWELGTYGVVMWTPRVGN